MAARRGGDRMLPDAAARTAPRPRIGAHITFSSRIPSRAVVAIAKAMPSTSGSSQVTFTKYAM